MHERIAITGVGVVSPAGSGKDAFWRGLVGGHSNTQPVPWQGSASRCKRVCRVEPFAAPDDLAEMSAAALYAVVAAKEALEDAGLDPVPEAMRMGVSLGTAAGHSERMFEYRSGAGEVFAPAMSPGRVITETFGLRGPVGTLPVACAAGTTAIVDGLVQLAAGRVDAILVGGTEGLSSVCFSGFASLNVLTDDMVRPFDADRSGFLIGEGAGMMVLEPMAAARRRNCTIYGEVLGFGLSADRHHIVQPHPQADGMSASAAAALRMAKADVDEIDYVNVHGTATLANDRAECQALEKIFATRRRPVVANSFKSTLGHTMGAAGAIETIGCLLSMRRGCIPPTWNFKNPAADCKVDCVPNAARDMPVRRVLKMSAGFGGSNCSVLLGSSASCC